MLPDGLTFATPVTLTFRYTDGEIANTSTDFLGIAFQADDGIWYRVPTEIDNSAKTITTKATHFTDWSVLSQLWISPTVPYLPEIEAGSTFALELIGFEDNSPPPNGPPSPAPQGDDLPSLPTPAPLRVQWYVNGVDSGNPNVGRIIIVAGANNQKVEYEAPATAPANNPVAVSAKLTGFRTWDFVNRRRRTFNEVILFKHIKIRDEWNYTLKIADTKLLYLACALQMTYLDSVKMDVHVKGQNVTITNIVNQAPVIDPMSNTNYCTITCDPGPFGSLNVSQGSGEKWPARDPVDGYFRFNLTLQHQSRGAGGKYLLECPDQDDLLVPSTPYTDTETHLTFILADSIQSVGSVGISYTLTPKGN